MSTRVAKNTNMLKESVQEQLNKKTVTFKKDQA